MGEADVKKTLSQILGLLEDKGITPKSKLEHLNKILELSKQVDDVSKFVPVTSFLRCIRPFLIHYSKTMRTASLRIVRYYLAKGPPGIAYIKDMITLRMHFFITRSLERDKHSEAERIQALKLVRAIMEADCSLMPAPIIQALIACAENQEDSFCRVCLETLCEIAIRNPQVVALCNGMRILFDSILDPFYQGIQESLVVAILYLLNDQHTRVYIRPRTDLQIILSPLTNTFNMGPLKNASKDKEKEKEKEDEINMKKWLACTKAIVTLLKSWTGIICLASDEQGLRSLVDALKMPYVDLHDKVLDALFEIFRLSQPKMTQTDPFRHHQNPNVSVDTSITLDLPSRTRAMRHNLLNNYIAMLLLAFMDCGLIEGLIQLTSNLPRDSSEAEKERSRIITQKSTILLGELLHLSNTLLPPSQCARLQTLPALVNRAISFAIDPRIRSRASTMVTNLHAYSHIKATSSFSDFYLSLIVTGANKWRRIKGKDRRLDKIDEVKMKMDWSLDDAQLLQKIKDSNVILTKDNLKWHWEIISELLSGALLNPAHLAKALSTKFIKRILSFLRPSNRLFSTMAWTADNLQYVRTACQVLELLVSAEIGYEYLKDNKFISSIAEMLRTEIDASLIEDQKQKPDRSNNRLLSSEKVLKTMSREYFTMLGTLSSTQFGLEIMTKNKLFDHLKPMSELPHRDDLSHLIMTSLDYNIAGESRAILAKALTSNSKVVRYLATRHMRVLLRAGVSMYHDWGVTMLVQQLNDNDPKVTQVALSVLDEACDESACLEAVIKHNPPLLKHGKPGKNLMLRFLSSTNGLRLLKDMDFINNEMQLWKDEENVNYLQSIEASLSEALSPTIWRQREGADQSNYGVYLPPHFYGELSKNAEGCEILKQSGHFDHILATAFDNATAPLLRRAALIALGHIGSSPTGFTFLEESKAVLTIVNICETCSCLSIRGTCFYVLGMISRIERARDILDQSGWESPAELHSCISVPKFIHTNPFLKVPFYEHCGSGPVPEAAGEGLDDIGKEVLGYVGKLSNHITADSASRNLKRMRAKNPEHFASAVMMHFVFQLMAGYKFRLGVRRFMYDCFDAAIFSEDLFSHWDSEPSARQN